MFHYSATVTYVCLHCLFICVCVSTCICVYVCVLLMLWVNRTFFAHHPMCCSFTFEANASHSDNALSLHSHIQYVTCRGHSEFSVDALIIAFVWEEDDHLSCRLRYKAPSYWSQWEQNITHLPSQNLETTYVWTQKAVTCELHCQCPHNTKSWLADSRSCNFNGVSGGLHAVGWLIWLNWLT